MTPNFLTHISSAAESVFKQPFIKPAVKVPDRLLVKPADVWPGNFETGQTMLEGAFTHYGDRYEFTDLWDRNIWMPFGISQNWLNYIHGFSWLRDLQSCISAEAHKTGFTLINNWITHNTSPGKDREQFNSWNPATLGERLCNWIAHYETFMAEFPEDAKDNFFHALHIQSRHLHKSLCGSIAHSFGSAPQGLPLLRALKGLLYCALALEGRENWLDDTLNLLEKELPKQIFKDGCHASRAPAQTFKALQILLDIRRALNAGGVTHPEYLQPAIAAIAQNIRFFRAGDKGLALFHGGQEEDRALIDSALAQAGPKGSIFQSLPQGGYERLSMGRTTILFDSGTPQPPACDENAHAAPLSFEMYHGKDRIFVNCGMHKTENNWRDSLRSTAAHNTLSIDHRNAYEIKQSGHLGRRARNYQLFRQDGKDYQLTEGSHDGYAPLNGLTHHRRLYLGKKGNDLRGEDLLESVIGKPSQPHNFAIRFHIHPRVLVSLVQDEHAALLRLPNGIGWRFHQSGGTLHLENSIYLGEGCQPRKTKQLTITGQTMNNLTTIKWALQRAGI